MQVEKLIVALFGSKAQPYPGSAKPAFPISKLPDNGEGGTGGKAGQGVEGKQSGTGKGREQNLMQAGVPTSAAATSSSGPSYLSWKQSWVVQFHLVVLAA